MRTLIEKLEKSYLHRCTTPSIQREIWSQIAREFPPELAPDMPLIPSKTIAREAGDLGVAMLWIVQASLIRGLTADITVQTTESIPALHDISPESIGALAHNDDRDNPVILSNGTTLNGIKRYITGGSTSDIIFVTAKERPDDKISRVFALRTATIPQGCLIELDLGHLKTVSHGRLALKDYTVKKTENIPIEGKDLRRSIKRWSIIERSLIMQSFLGLMAYINNAAEDETGTAIIEKDRLDDALGLADEIVATQIKSACTGGMIEEKNPDFRQIMEFVGLCNAFVEMNRTSLSENLLARIPDLNFMQKTRI